VADHKAKKRFIAQVAGVLFLVVAIVAAILVQKLRQEAFMRGPGSLKPAVISKVKPGQIVVDGRPAEWGALSRYPLTGPDAPSGGGSSWDELRAAHDGSTLYLLVTLGRTVEEECRQRGPRVTLGIISLDIGAELSRAAAPSSEEEAFQSDCDIGLSTDVEGTPPQAGVAYILPRFQPGGSDSAAARKKTSHADPDRVGFSGRTVEMAIPFSALGIAPPVKLLLAVHPVSAPQIHIFGVRIE